VPAWRCTRRRHAVEPDMEEEWAPAGVWRGNERVRI
jgi:hypothetical protein